MRAVIRLPSDIPEEWMTRVKFSALVWALVLGTSFGATASAQDRKPDQFTRHEQSRNPDRDRWTREHHNDQRRDLERDRRQREAMHRWDREHQRHPMTARHYEPKHDGWDRGKKAGGQSRPAPHGKPQPHTYVKQNERRVAPAANLQMMNRLSHDERTAPALR